MNAKELATFIGATHLFVENGTPQDMRREIRILADLLEHLDKLIARRTTDGKACSVEQNEARALRFAVRVLTDVRAREIAVEHLT